MSGVLSGIVNEEDIMCEDIEIPYFSTMGIVQDSKMLSLKLEIRALLLVKFTH